MQTGAACRFYVAIFHRLRVWDRPQGVERRLQAWRRDPSSVEALLIDPNGTLQ
jgi:hypothetical protein